MARKDQDDRAVMREVGRRLTGSSGQDLASATDVIRNPLVRGIAHALGVDLSKADESVEQARRLAISVDASVRMLAPLGWAIFGRTPAKAYQEAVELYEANGSAAEIDQLLTDAWRDNVWLRMTFSHLPSLSGRHEPTRTVLLRRLELLNRALRHHLDRQYEAAVLIILTQVDGLVYDFLGDRGFFTAPGLEFRDDATLAGMPGSLEEVRRRLNRGSDRTSFDGEFRRHAIIHGRELNYGTETNSTKAFVLLGAVIEWLQPQARTVTERRQQEHEARYSGSDEVDGEGRRLDQRGFVEARASLRKVYFEELVQFRANGRYSADLRAMFPRPSGFGSLPEREAITLQVSEDGQRYWAWRATPSGYCLGIGGEGGEIVELLYAGKEPPGALGAEPRWVSSSERWLPDWSGE